MSSLFLPVGHFLASVDVDMTTMMQCQNAGLAPSGTDSPAPTDAPKAAQDFGGMGVADC